MHRPHRQGLAAVPVFSLPVDHTVLLPAIELSSSADTEKEERSFLSSPAGSAALRLFNCPASKGPRISIILLTFAVRDRVIHKRYVVIIILPDVCL